MTYPISEIKTVLHIIYLVLFHHNYSATPFRKSQHRTLPPQTALESVYPSELPTIMKSFFLCYGDETPGSVEPSGEHASCFGGGSSECLAQGNLESLAGAH